MYKRIICIIILAAVGFGFVFGVDGTFLIVVDQGAKILAEPEFDSQVVTGIPIGSPLYILERGKNPVKDDSGETYDWYRVDFGSPEDINGWIYGKFAAGSFYNNPLSGIWYISAASRYDYFVNYILISDEKKSFFRSLELNGETIAFSENFKYYYVKVRQDEIGFVTIYDTISGKSLFSGTYTGPELKWDKNDLSFQFVQSGYSEIIISNNLTFSNGEILYSYDGNQLKFGDESVFEDIPIVIINKYGLTNDNVKVRNGPGTSFAPFALPLFQNRTSYPKGTEVRVVGRTKEKVRIGEWLNYWILLDVDENLNKPEWEGARKWTFGEFIDIKD